MKRILPSSLLFLLGHVLFIGTAILVVAFN